ncbi:metallophosphoesterase family protein [Aureibacter tunicatorum]|uniref:Serine/threonine protein phosphatase 1 n=1 Tax=Aureibacter tunicatorum TaxID=866807 RepID=A0AAE4BT58_9BACT|nr:metallophosphoesterase family protein [Aureibacter tunicatorum]MDR6239187.1 serine/threonine protein phosphatase 1 [Aureibacter tunicatorum]BDD04887.1 serine/threonine protein phosphatase [Aureibacter tunicatorum]
MHKKFVISDIHGCLKTFQRLLHQINFKPKDKLFLLGDYVNKGPNSKKVLDIIIELQTENPSHIFPLLGNHDLLLLKALKGNNQAINNISLFDNSEYFLESLEKDKKKYIHFLSALPYYIETKKHFLVHAGFDFTQENFLKIGDKMLTIRDFPVNLDALKGKTIIHGHNPKPLEYIEEKIKMNSPVIPLDNGCVMGSKKIGMGHLLCLELKTMTLFKEKYAE